MILPGLGTLYFTLAGLWNLPNAEQTVGSIAALNVFLGVLVNVSSRTYHNSDQRYDGSIALIEDPNTGKRTYTLELNGNPDDLEFMDEVLFRMKK